MDTYCFELQIAPTLLLFFTVYKLPQHISSLSSVLYLNMLIAWLQTQVTGTVPNVSVLDGSHWLSLYNFVTDRLENTTFNSSSTVMRIFTATALWWTFSKKIYIICYYAFISDWVIRTNKIDILQYKTRSGFQREEILHLSYLIL